MTNNVIIYINDTAQLENLDTNFSVPAKPKVLKIKDFKTPRIKFLDVLRPLKFIEFFTCLQNKINKDKMFELSQSVKISDFGVKEKHNLQN